MPTKLDPREARPLTSREISKVLCAILGGVFAVDPMAVQRVPDLIAVARAGEISPWVHSTTNWELAFASTVSGFRGWCAPTDVDIALAWVSENIDRITGMLRDRSTPAHC